MNVKRNMMLGLIACAGLGAAAVIFATDSREAGVFASECERFMGECKRQCLADPHSCVSQLTGSCEECCRYRGARLGICRGKTK